MTNSCDCKAIGKIAAVAVVLRAVLEGLVHQVLLKGTYMHPWYTHVWNPMETMKARMPAMWLSHILFGIVFAAIYTRGYEDAKPALGQGARYGFWIGLLFASGALIEYFVYPVSCRLVAAWIGTGIVECMIIGAAVALVYRPQPHSHA